MVVNLGQGGGRRVGGVRFPGRAAGEEGEVLVGGVQHVAVVGVRVDEPRVQHLGEARVPGARGRGSLKPGVERRDPLGFIFTE